MSSPLKINILQQRTVQVTEVVLWSAVAIWSEETNEARTDITHGNMYIKLRRRECNVRPSGLRLQQLLL
jgi:hypothetical protein